MAGAGRPTLVLIAGPNGAGKTTLYETRVAPGLAAPFINADLIQRDELKDRRPEAAYEAARLAEERRRSHLRDRTSFVTETVFSHPSKLELITDARGLEFRIMTLHVSVGDPSLSVARVAARVSEGGHDVPDEKIRARYHRNAPLIRQAVLMSDMAHVYDNSGLNTPPERILTFSHGHVTYAVPNLPDWAAEIYADELAV